MAHKTQKGPIKAIALQAGQRVFSPIVNAVQTHTILFTASALVVIGVGGGTAVRNKGSVFALFDELGLSENGTDKAVLDGRLARFIAELYAPSALSATRLPSAAAQTITIKEQLAVHFASPLSATPAETTFREHVAKNALEVFAKLNGGTLIDRLISGAPGGSSVTAVTLTAQHIYDQRTQKKPFFIPTYRQSTLAIPSGSTEWPLDIKSTKFIRGMFIQQDSDAGEVGDVIVDLELRGDFRQILGPGRITWDDLTRAQEQEFGGAVYITGTGLGQNAYLGLNFQKGGRLSNVINPSDDTNLRFLFNAAPSGAAGATNSKIRVAIAELETDEALTQHVGDPGFPPV